MPRYIKKIHNIPFSVLSLIAFTCFMLVISTLTSTASNAQVAVAPSSYVTTDGQSTELVKGQPQEVNGKPVKYTTTHTIPIDPKVTSRDTKTGVAKTVVSIPSKKPCYPAGDRDCGEVK